MAELLLMNPAHRPRRRKSRKHRTAAQRAATRRLVAFNRARRRSGSASANPRRRRHHNPVAIHHRRRVRRHNPAHVMHHRRRHRRHNPAMGITMRSVGSLVQDGLVGAGGALAVDITTGFLPLPAMLKSPANADGSTNWLYYATKTGIALLVGTFGRRLFGRFAHPMAVGSMTVTAYGLARTLLPSGLTLGYMAPGHGAGMARYVSGLGRYVSGQPGDIQQRVMASPSAQARLANVHAFRGTSATKAERAMYNR